MGYAPMFPLILSMSLPAMFSMTVMALYNVVDSIFVGNIPVYGETGLNAISYAFPLQMLMISFAVGTAVGSNSLISRRLGAGLQKEAESLKYGIAGCIAHPQVDMQKVNYSKQPWALEPTQMISYVSCHDDMCLVDRLKASIPGIQQEELIRLDLLAQTAVFTAQGVPFMLSGEELLRDKKGVHKNHPMKLTISIGATRPAIRRYSSIIKI